MKRWVVETISSILIVYMALSKPDRVKQFLENNLEQMMLEQEDILHIKHVGKPVVHAGLPKESNRIVGLYEPVGDTIFIKNTEVLDTNTAIPHIHNRFGESKNIKYVLDHELGHFYIDKLCEAKGLGDYNFEVLTGQSLSFQIAGFQTLGINLINEGIAEYFERTVNNLPDTYTDAEYPDSIFLFLSYRHKYDGGYHLVKPILDSCGMESVFYLITHPPNFQELLDLPKYRTNVLNDLKKDCGEKDSNPRRH